MNQQVKWAQKPGDSMQVTIKLSARYCHKASLIHFAVYSLSATSVFNIILPLNLRLGLHTIGLLFSGFLTNNLYAFVLSTMRVLRRFFLNLSMLFCLWNQILHFLAMSCYMRYKNFRNYLLTLVTVTTKLVYTILLLQETKCRISFVIIWRPRSLPTA